MEQHNQEKILRLKAQSTVLRALREFFEQEGFDEFMPPPIVSCGSIEPHIFPIKIQSAHLNSQELHTSPEFALKQALALGFKKIYNISFSFRDEPHSELHRPQFLMLEWYRTKASYLEILEDCKKIFLKVHCNLQNAGLPVINRQLIEKMKVVSLCEYFFNITGKDLLGLQSFADWRRDFPKHFSHLNSTDLKKMAWEDYFFTVFLNEVEPALKNEGIVFLVDYPAQLAALSKISPTDSRLANRFEVYISGIELGNCYQELTGLEEQTKRYQESKALAFHLYQREIPKPDVLLNALNLGLPESAGIAMGVERLTMVLTGLSNAFWD